MHEEFLLVVITGGNGFIGRRVVRRLLRRGDGVIALGRHPTAIVGAEDVHVAMLAADHLGNALEGRRFDAVVHLAAFGVNPADRDPSTLTEINARLPATIVSLASRVGAKAVVVAGSSAEYAPSQGKELVTEEAPLERKRPYGASKALGSERALSQGARSGIAVGVARLFNVFGPGEHPHRLLPTLVERLTAGRTVELTSGSQVRDFIHVDDASDALIAMLDALVAGTMRAGAYNVCTGAANSVRRFAQATAAVLGRDDALLAFGALPLRNEEIDWIVGDPSRLDRACGWRARLTMEEGIAATIDELDVQQSARA
jgi:nucleoside-diphosphate-sugar epimerase